MNLHLLLEDHDPDMRPMLVGQFTTRAVARQARRYAQALQDEFARDYRPAGPAHSSRPHRISLVKVPMPKSLRLATDGLEDWKTSHLASINDARAQVDLGPSKLTAAA